MREKRPNKSKIWPEERRRSTVEPTLMRTTGDKTNGYIAYTYNDPDNASVLVATGDKTFACYIAKEYGGCVYSYRVNGKHLADETFIEDYSK